jgi:hypothetical protein
VAKEKPKAKDQHKSGFLLRLPESYRKPLQELKRKTRRAMTVEVQMALDRHLRENGIAPPVAST